VSFVGKFFALVVIVGVAELYLLVYVAARLGLWGTAALCVLTGVIGGSLVRAQGLEALRQIQRSLAQGIAPAREIVGGLMLLLIGAMMIVPGFITDTLGFALLVPALRRQVAALIVSQLQDRVQLTHIHEGSAWPGDPDDPRGSRRHVIDVDP